MTEGNEGWFRVKFIHLATVIINLFVLASGTSFAWSSPALSKLKQSSVEAGNPLGVPVTTTEESLITSLYLVGAAVTPPLTSFTSQKLGRRNAMLLMTIPLFAGCVIKTMAAEVWLFCLARFLCGTSAATAFTIIPIYVAEIAETSNRGALGTYVGVLTVLGYFYSYAVGPYVSIMWLSIGCSAFCVLFAVMLFFFVPDSPYYLLAAGKNGEALNALSKFRSKTPESCTDELKTMGETLVALRANQSNIMELFVTETGMLRCMIIMFGLFIIQQFTGSFAVLAYLQSIFEKSGAGNLSAAENGIIIGAVKIFACIITPTVVDRLGRRMLMIISAIGTCLSLTALSTFFFLLDEGKNGGINWLPVTSLVLFTVSFNIGLATVPLVLIGELFPPGLKAQAGAIVIIFSSAMSFVVAISFPHMTAKMGLGASFCFYAVVAALGAVFCAVLVPETKGKTFVEIQHMLRKKNIK